MAVTRCGSLSLAGQGRTVQDRALSGLDRAETATELRAEGAWQGLKRRVLCARGGMGATAHTSLVGCDEMSSRMLPVVAEASSDRLGQWRPEATVDQCSDDTG